MDLKIGECGERGRNGAVEWGKASKSRVDPLGSGQENRGQ